MASARGLLGKGAAAAGTLAGSGWFTAALAAAAVAPRAFQMAAGRSLWLDEAFLALNIIGKTPGQLLGILELKTMAPPGYLLAVKGITLAAGEGEIALRALSLISSLAALWLLCRLTRGWAGRPAALFALALMAFSRTQIYYATELKQYMSDIAIALLVLLVMDRLREGRGRARGFAAGGLIGAAAVWCSFPAAFVLAGAGAVVVLDAARRRDGRRAAAAVLMCLGWLVSFALMYRLFVMRQESVAALTVDWRRSFMPLGPFRETAGWLVDSAFSLVRITQRGTLPRAAAGLLALTGLLVLLRRRTAPALMIVLTAAAALGASSLHLYPFRGRPALYLTPLVMLLAAAGAGWIAGRFRGAASTAAVATLAAVTLAAPAWQAARIPWAPFQRHELKAALNYVEGHRRRSDLIYVAHPLTSAMRYYAPRRGLEEGEYLLGESYRGSVGILCRSLETLKGRGRVWVLLPTTLRVGGETIEKASLGCLDALGTRRSDHRVPGIGVYQYRFPSSAGGRERVYHKGHGD